MGTWGLYKEFGLRYDRNHFRNEFLRHENISIDTWIEILCAMVCALCHYVYENTEIEKG